MKKTAIVLLHIGYWGAYSFLLFVLTIFMHGQFIFRGFSLFVFLLSFAFVPAVLSFYSFYTFLFTRFLKQEKILLLVLSGITTAVFYGWLGWLLLDIAWIHIGPVNKVAIDVGGYPEITVFIIIAAVNALLNGIIGMVMRGFINWYADIKWKEALNRKNFEMELALVKSQISPHFLFNTINNIDILIEKDSRQASVYLNKLSDLLRFMLYETKPDKILLAKELAYIEKYIDLQKIRSARPDFVRYTVEGVVGSQMVAPLLFIPFIENAFKHAESRKESHTIDVRIQLDQNSICFTCSNRYQPVAAVKPDYGGLGNELIQKRLALLYPGQHELIIKDDDNVYTVTLILRHEN